MLAVGVGNVRRTVYKCIGLGLFVRVGKRRRKKIQIFAGRVIFDGGAQKGKFFWLCLPFHGFTNFHDH